MMSGAFTELCPMSGSAEPGSRQRRRFAIFGRLGWLAVVSLFLMVSLAFASAEKAKIVRLYLDADQVGARSSSLAIEQGIRTALSEVDNQLGGYAVELVIKNHRGNSRRSLDNLRDFLADERALAVFAGLHSPPLLANLKFINQRGILLLDPWAAAGPITRYAAGENWVFRLSVDDSKAGHEIVRHTLETRGLKRPALLLEETGWGKSNQKTMTLALGERGRQSAGVFWFNWGLGPGAARILLRDIFNSGADSILLVANAPEAKTLARAMIDLQMEQRLPIFSHWGLTGGDFPEVIDAGMRGQFELNFLQTRFSFVSHPDEPFGRQVLARARDLFPEIIRTAADIRAPSGFIHGYDLTRLLIAAVEQVGLDDDMVRNRRRIRGALEQLNKPVPGLIKTYDRPFGPFDAAHPDAHEALGIEDLVMARYGAQNQILLLDKGIR